MQGAHIVDADVAEAVARYMTVLRGTNAAGVTAASFRFFTPDTMVPVWQVLLPMCIHIPFSCVWSQEVVASMDTIAVCRLLSSDFGLQVRTYGIHRQD